MRPPPEVPDTGVESTERHLRAASDAILLLVAEVAQLETHKRGVRPADQRFTELAEAVRVAAQALAEFAHEEEAWARSANTKQPDVAAIAQSPSQPVLSEILERWRAIERGLEHAEPGSAEAARLFEDFQRARDEYVAAFRAREARQ